MSGADSLSVPTQFPSCTCSSWSFRGPGRSAPEAQAACYTGSLSSNSRTRKPAMNIQRSSRPPRSGVESSHRDARHAEESP